MSDLLRGAARGSKQWGAGALRAWVLGCVGIASRGGCKVELPSGVFVR